jgi:hypothetical protein
MSEHLGSPECFAGEKKVYKIWFNRHTNCMFDTVVKEKENGDSVYMSLVKDSEYESEGYLMIFTNDLGECLKELQDYGGGIKRIEYIGQAFCRVYPKESKNEQG